MLDIKLIRKDKEKIESLIKTKEPSLNLTTVVKLDDRIREIKSEDEKIKAKRNDLSKKVGELKQKGQDAKELMDEVRNLGDDIATLDRELKE